MGLAWHKGLFLRVCVSVCVWIVGLGSSPSQKHTLEWTHTVGQNGSGRENKTYFVG